MATYELTDNQRERIPTALLRHSVYSCLAGYEDINDSLLILLYVMLLENEQKTKRLPQSARRDALRQKI